MTKSVRKPASATRVLALSISCALSLSAHAQSTPDVEEKKEAKNLAAVVVTGSSLATTSAAMQGPVPVKVITALELQQVGATTVFEALQTEPYFAGYADNDTRSGASGNNVVNLRGLGQEYTLVLLNGRRVASGDLNQVPFAAVDRIEIVKDGASAVYGSDALAGVVNIILKDHYDGFQVTANYGNTTHFNDGMRAQASFLSGLSTEKGSFLLSGQFEKQNSVLSLEHPLGKTDDQRPWGGPDLRANRYNPGLITLNDGSELMLNPSFGNGQTGTSAGDYVPAYFLPLEKRQSSNLQNDKEVGTLYANGRYRLADDKVELFADFLYKKSKIGYVDHRGTYLNYDVPASNYWNPFGQAVHVDYLLDYGTADGRLERPLETMRSDITTAMFTFGARGSLGPIDYELTYSDYKIEDLQSHDGLSKAKLTELLARTDSSALNLFGNAAVTAEQLEGARAFYSRRFMFYVRSLTGVARFSPFELPAGPLAAAVGFESRRQGFEAVRDAALNAGDAGSLTYLNDSSIGLDRDVDALYAEVNVPLASASSNLPLVHALDLGIAVRREKFSDFGSATVPRVSLRWEPFADGSLMFRGSYSESFYAPNLDLLTPAGDVDAGLYADPLIVDANGDPLYYNIETESGGNPNLDATKGKYYNLGVVYSPTWLEGLNVSLDAYKLTQEDAFIYPDVQIILDGGAPGTIIRSTQLTPSDQYSGAPVGRVTRVVARVANAASRRIEGVDLNLNYAFDTDRAGRWNVALYNTFTTKFEYDNRDGSGTQNALGNLLFGSVPRYRGKFAVSQTLGPWTSTLGTNYFGDVKNSFYNDDQVGAYTTTDLTVLYDFDKRSGGGGAWSGSTLGLHVTNLFDQDEPIYLAYRVRGLATSYDYVDQVGQFVTLSFTKKF